MAPSVWSAPFVRSFSSSGSGQRLAGGCAVLVGPGEPLGCPLTPEDTDDLPWSDAQIAAFLAGEPLTLGWVTQASPSASSPGAYVCCWITVDSD